MCFPIFLCAQSISGKVESTTGEKIQHAQMIFKDSAQAPQIKEFALIVNGVYQHQIKRTYRTLWIEVTAMGYKKSGFLIDSLAPQAYTHDFLLEVENTDLQEVILSSSKRYEQNGDTTSFNVSAYRDGTERKIEEIIKKLPGIEVNESTGAIKYKGKLIETVKLDGDDLFDSNYAIGTRNINVDMIEQVQAIENYQDNPLLKGVNADDKVALNLVLKETGMKYSGSTDIGIGLFLPKKASVATQLGSTLLGIATKYKSFVNLNYNNVGTNNTPYNYTEYTEEIDVSKNPDMFAIKYIPDTYFYSTVGARRSTFNNSFFGSYNATFKATKLLRIKINLFHLNDKINAEQYTQHDYVFNNERFTTSDATTIQKMPKRYVGRLQLHYNLSKNSILEYLGNYDFEKINTHTNLLQNETINYANILKTTSNLLKNKLTYTNRLSKRIALQITGNYTLNDAPQNYYFLPSVYQSTVFNSNNQSSEFRKEYADVNVSLLGNHGKEEMSDKDKNKYEIFGGGISYKTIFNASLTGYSPQETSIVADFLNQVHYRSNRVYGGGKYHFFRKRLKIALSFKLSYLEQFVEDYLQKYKKESQILLLEPDISVSYKTGEKSKVIVRTTYKPSPFSEDYFITRPVYQSVRLTKYNDLSLNTQQHSLVNAGYAMYDLARSLRITFMGVYAVRKGNYYDRLTIQTNNTNLTSFFLPEVNTVHSVNFMIEKYLHLMSSTIRLQTSYSLVAYQNIISEVLRKNKAKSIQAELFFKTAFDIPINFENVAKYFWNEASAEGATSFSNQNLINNFKIIVKTNRKLFIVLNHEYFLPSFQNKATKASFIDGKCTYQMKRVQWALTLRNIANTRTFDQISVTDYASYTNRTNLLPRHFLINCYLSF
jgi:hypothetical protein